MRIAVEKGMGKKHEQEVWKLVSGGGVDILWCYK